MANKIGSKKTECGLYVSLTPWFLYAFALIMTYYFVSKGASFWPSYLVSVVFFNGGVQGIWGAIGHLFLAEQSAKGIGWKSSGFQTEMGFSNLAIGIAGLLTIHFNAWAIPVGLILALLFAGCVFGHIKDRIVNGNTAPCNTGPMLYNTILVSISVFVAIFMSI